jgi:L-ascorbate metabolism protein UlaG (beta-lactamase superfamily)
MKSLIPAYQKNEALIQDIKSTPGAPDRLSIWWLGQSGFLIKWLEFYLLIDPYLSDSLTFKYQDTDKPHVRISEKVLEPQVLDFIHLVTTSHNHTDHLDKETLVPIIQASPGVELILPEANRAFVNQRLGTPLDFGVGLTDQMSHSLPNGITIHGISAAHETEDRNEIGQPVFMGYVFYIGPFVVYHSGDCIPFESLVPQLKPHAIDIALLPVNGRAPERKVSGNFTCQEACQLALDVNAKLLIPCHYDLFEFNTVDIREFIKCADQVSVPYHVLQLGERLDWPIAAL